MAEPDTSAGTGPEPGSAAQSVVAPSGATRPSRNHWFILRRPAPRWQSILLGFCCVGAVFTLWWFVTSAEIPEERLVTPATLPSPAETFGEFKSLWFDRALTRNMFITLRRVGLGFLLAATVGIPLGVLAGCFTRFEAFLSPLVIFGRNIPLAALTMLTFFIFGIGEQQKVMFIFIACVAFIISDVTQGVRDVGQRYVDTALTLGARRWQVIMKVLVPLAMPSIFNSLRLLFGLAFGYIMLAELVKIGDEEGGLGYLILVSQRKGPREHIYLIVLIIPVVAFLIDRLLFWMQRELFPHRYGGFGLLNKCVRFV